MREHTYKTMPGENKEEILTPKEEESMDEDDKKILDDIEESKKNKEETEETEEGNQKETPSPEDKAKKEEAEPKENLDNKDKEDDKENKKSEKQERTPRVMPLYKHKIAEKKWEKEKKELSETIKKLESSSNKDKKEETSEKIETKISAFAEKHKMKPEIIKELIGLFPKQEQDASLRKDIDKINKERIERKQDAIFDKNYEKKILPLLKQLKIPEKDYGDIKKSLHDKAFTEQFAKTPIDFIFKGDSFFDRFRSSEDLKKKKGFEDKGKGTRGGDGDEKKKPKDMSSKEFDEWEKEIETESRKSGIEIRRDGKVIH